MAELNLKQITDKLNSEFASDVRKLVFWYDANAEFVEDIDTIELNNAKVLHLEKDNQFYIKYFLECEDTTTNYLVYAPFSKPAIKDNHLADTIRYSKEFFADRASLLIIDLGVDEKYKSIIQHHNKFFANKERTQKFADFELEKPNQSMIEIALMSVLCKSKIASFEEVMRCILTDDGLIDNKYLAEFEKYDLLNAFWQQTDINFGYNDNNPTLEKLVMTMFITYTSKVIYTDIPQAWKPFVSYKPGNVRAFIDNLMNSYLYGKCYDEISDTVYSTINGKKYFSNINVEALVDCNLFSGIDEIIIDWLIDRLVNEDIGAKLNGKTIPEICADRRKQHFGKNFRNDYFVLENAYYIISSGTYQFTTGIRELSTLYTESLFKIDRRYRYFYYFYDNLEDSTKYETLRELVENFYTNEYLNKITVNWSNELVAANGATGLILQKDFFNRYVKNSNDRVVVIVSDAFRYEVAYTLFEKFLNDEKCMVKMTPMQGVLPSYTQLGMSALLPYEKIEYNENYDVVLDGKTCALTEQKASHLLKYKVNSNCVPFDAFKNMKQADLRNVFTGQDVVYIYHNQVDARGDDSKTENEVFTACEEAIEEIYALVRKISSQANTYHFLITSDHGFIYKRDALSESDKIKAGTISSGTYGKRYVVSEQCLETDGVETLKLTSVNNDNLFVSFPVGSDIFKTAGAGLNFVHGGTSPQEMIVPLIDVKVDKYKKETSVAEISLVSLTNKITNLITTLDFIQTEPVSDIIKETSYRVYFISEENEKISNENIVIVDKKDKDTMKRMFRLRFNFKDRQYNKSQKYYLVAYDTQNDIETLRHEIIMDIAFADDFGFFG